MSVPFKVLRTDEIVLCDNPKKDIQVIDGVEYLIVSRQNSNRKFLMRKEALGKVKLPA
jgi:hypothetical protein